MLYTGLGEEEITRSEGMSLIADDVEATAVHNDVQLILIVGLLVIGVVRRIHTGVHRAVTYDLCVSIVGR